MPHMRWVACRSISRCLTAAERIVASAYAAPPAPRFALAALAGGGAAAARLAFASSNRDLSEAADYLAVSLSGLLGGFAPGAVAALACALLRLGFPPPSGADASNIFLFLTTSAFLLAIVEAFHRMRLRAHAGRAASELLANVVVAAPGVVGTFYVDARGHVAYRYVSPKAKSVFGLDPADIRADAGVFFKRLSKDDLDMLNAGLRRSARELSLWVVEFLFDHPDKGMIWMEAQAAPVREAGGLVVWHGYASDITPRKRAELSLAESAARLQAAIDAAPDAVLTMDAVGRIQTINRAGAAMFGYRPDEFAAMNIRELIAPEAGGTNEWTQPAADERREIRGLSKNGDAFPAEMTLSETAFERESLRVAIIKDLTERRKIERHIEQLHRNRLDAMGGMAAALAHEINQPLAANATYLRVARRLIEKSPHADDAAIVDVLEKATTQTLRAGRIVTSLKDLVRRGEPDKTLVGMHDLIMEAVDAAIEECEDSKVKFEMRRQAPRDRIVADRTQLKQVLFNLVRNAMEAMQSSERRELVISTANPGDGTIRVDVIDSGCGLPESCEIGRFEPFTTTKTKGMGVGLSISRSIIEAHYGRIWASPNAGDGATFSFALPLQDADADA
ncbi:PAS domain S-box protein [Methylocystis sp. S23]